jgi:hypothetical protein
VQESWKEVLLTKVKWCILSDLETTLYTNADILHVCIRRQYEKGCEKKKEKSQVFIESRMDK